MNIVERAKSILLKPKDTWPIIDAESATAAGLYSGYLAILAAIPAVCGFIGMSLIGFGGFGVSIRVPIAAGLANMVVSYVLSLAGIYVLALIIDALAPTFGGTKNSLQALKVAVYGSTAALVGGVFSLVPALSILGLLAALYSIYLVYTGLPVLMKSPQEKSVAYTAVVIVAAVVVGIVIGAVASVFTSRSMALGYGAVDSSPASITMHTPSGQVKIDAAALEAAGKKMAAAAQAMERAQQPGGDVGAATAVAGSVAAAAMGAMGGGDGAPIPADILKAALPAQLSGFARTAIEAQQGAAMGIGSSQAKAEYGVGDKTVNVEIADMGAMGRLALAAGGVVQGERETADSVEKTWSENGRVLHHRYRKDASYSEFKATLKNGVVVSVEGNGVGIQDLRGIAGQIDLQALESLERPKKS